jgi:hypothetical protein
LNPAAWAQLCDAFAAGVPLHELEHQLAQIPMLTEDERSALWLYAWSRDERDHHRPSVKPPLALRWSRG